MTRGTVTEVGHSDLIGVVSLNTHRIADRVQGLRADDDLRCRHVELVRVEGPVHLAAPSEDEICRARMSHGEYADLAVAGEEKVVGSGGPCRTDLDRLLTLSRRPETQMSLTLESDTLRIDPPDQSHVAVQTAKNFGIEIGDPPIQLRVSPALAVWRQQHRHVVQIGVTGSGRGQGVRHRRPFCFPAVGLVNRGPSQSVGLIADGVEATSASHLAQASGSPLSMLRNTRTLGLLWLGTMGLLDHVDLELLNALADDHRATVVALADRLGLSRNTVQARMAKLERSGVFFSFERAMSPKALGLPIEAMISITVHQADLPRITSELAELPEVVQVHGLSGQIDLMARVAARDTQHLFEVDARILSIDGVERTETSLVMGEVIGYRVRPLLEALRAEPGRPESPPRSA